MARLPVIHAPSVILSAAKNPRVGDETILHVRFFAALRMTEETCFHKGRGNMLLLTQIC